MLFTAAPSFTVNSETHCHHGLCGRNACSHHSFFCSVIICCFIGQCAALISTFVFQQTATLGCCLGLLLHHAHCVSAHCLQWKAGTKFLFLPAIFVLIFYLLFPSCTSECVIKMCFTVNSESVSHAGVICQFQSVASQIQSYNTCSDTVCTRTVPLFCVAHLHTRLCHREKLFVYDCSPPPYFAWKGGGFGDTVCHTSMLPHQ